MPAMRILRGWVIIHVGRWRFWGNRLCYLFWASGIIIRWHATEPHGISIFWKWPNGKSWESSLVLWSLIRPKIFKCCPQRVSFWDDRWNTPILSCNFDLKAGSFYRYKISTSPLSCSRRRRSTIISTVLSFRPSYSPDKSTLQPLSE